MTTYILDSWGVPRIVALKVGFKLRCQYYLSNPENTFNSALTMPPVVQTPLKLLKSAKADIRLSSTIQNSSD